VTHHRLVHEGGWRIWGNPNETIRFFAPDGRWFEQGPPALREDLRERVEALVGGPSPELARAGPSP
jgi:hypothetical protein